MNRGESLTEQTPIKIDRKVAGHSSVMHTSRSRFISIHHRHHIRELDEDFIREKLMSQYFAFQAEVNNYIAGEYGDQSEVKPLQTPHELYRIRKVEDTHRQLTLSPKEVEILFSPDSKKIAILGKGYFDVHFLSDFSDIEESEPHSRVNNIFVHPHERAVFTPDSSMILVYSCFSFKLVDIESNSIAYSQTFDNLVDSFNIDLPCARNDPHFNRESCFGMFFWKLSEQDNVVQFIFFSPVLIYSFEVHTKEALKAATPVLNIHLIKSSTGRQITVGTADVRMCSGGGNTVFALERAADDSLIVWKGLYTICEGSPDSDLGSIKIRSASIHFEPLPSSFDYFYEEVPLSTITIENNIGIEYKDGSKSKIFFDTKGRQISRVTYSNTGCEIQKLFNLDADARLVTSFDDSTILAIVGVDSYLGVWIAEEKRVVNILKTHVDGCIGLAVTPNNRHLLLLTEAYHKTPRWKVEIVPIELQRHTFPEELCFDYSRRFDQAIFLKLTKEYIMFLEDGHKLIVRYFDKRDDTILDLLDHPTYNPNPLNQRFVFESPTSENQKPYSIKLESYKKDPRGLIVHYSVENRYSQESGQLIQVYLYSDLKRYLMLDTLGIDKPFAAFKHFSTSYDLAAAFIYCDGSIYSRKVSDLEFPLTPIVTGEVFHRRWQERFIRQIDFLHAFSSKAKQQESMGTFFDFINKEYVDCSIIKDKTHLVITNMMRELKAESFFEEAVHMRELVKANHTEILYCLFGEDGLVLIDRKRDSFFWYKTPKRIKKVLMKDIRIEDVSFTPNNKFVVISIRTDALRYFISLNTDSLHFEDILVDEEMPPSADTIFTFTESSFYWIYVNGFAKTIEIFNIELHKSVCKIPITNMMDVKFIFIEKGKLTLVGLLGKVEGTQGEKSFISHTLFKYEIPISPEKNSLLPLIQHQMVKYFTTDYSEVKDLCAANINSLLNVCSLHVVKMNSIFTIIMFMLNNKKAFKNFTASYQPIEVMLENHKLIRLFFKTNKPESTALTVQLIDAYVEKNKDHPFLDEEFIHKQITTGGQQFMRNPASQLMMRRLLFSPVGETPPIGLKNEWRAMKRLREDSSDNIKSNVVIDTYMKLVNLEARNPKNYNCFETKIKLDLSNGSDFSLAFFDMLSKASDVDLIERYKVMIYYKWAKISYFAFFYSTIFWTMTILYYIYFGFPNKFGYWGILLAALTIAFLIFELKCASSNFKKYLMDFWNVFDLIILTIGVTVSLIIVEDESNDLETRNQYALAWLRTIVVVGLCARSLTLLKVFSMTRYIISMFIRVFENLIPFLIIIMVLIMTYAYMWMMVPVLSKVNGDDQVSFYHSIESPINILFGNAEILDEELGAVKFITVLLGNIIFALTLVNFLIAIITATFDNVSEKKDIHDVKELLTMIRDFDAFFHGFRKASLESHFYLSLIEKSEKEDTTHLIMDSQVGLKKEIRFLGTHFDSQFEGIKEMIIEQQNAIKDLAFTITSHAKILKATGSGMLSRENSLNKEANVMDNSTNQIESEDVGRDNHHIAPKYPIGPRHRRRLL